MHISSLAPVLSATASRVCIWIMVRPGPLHLAIRYDGGLLVAPLPPGQRPRAAARSISLPLRHHPHQLPALRPRQRPALDDLHRVAGVRLVVLVVDVADRPAAEVLAVLGVPSPGGESPPAGSWPSCRWSRCRLQLVWAWFAFPRLLDFAAGWLAAAALAAAARRARSAMVLIRAINRRCLRSSLGASSRSVCACSRRRKKCSVVSFSSQPKLLVAHFAKFAGLGHRLGSSRSLA